MVGNIPSWAIPSDEGDSATPSWAVPSEGAPKKKTGLGRAIFPRTTAPEAQSSKMSWANNPLMDILRPVLDITSLPGRFLASTDAGKTDLGAMAETGGDNLTQQILRDPALIPSMAAGGVSSSLLKKGGVEGVKRLAGIGLAEGVTGAAAHQTANLAEGREVSPAMGAFEALLGPTLAVAPTVGNKVAGRIGSTLSGVSEDALRAYGTGLGPKAASIKAASGKTNEIGQRLNAAIEDASSYMPEGGAVQAALSQMPNVNIARTIQVLQDRVDLLKNPTAGSGAFGFEQKAIKELEGDIAALRGRSKKFPKTSFPAEGVRDLRRRLDVETNFGDESDNIVNQTRKGARTQLKNDLIDAAKASGNPEYVSAMESWANKLQKLEELKGFLGDNKTVRKQRVEAFLSNIGGKNKTERRKLLADIGDIFGEDFLGQVKLSNYAEELGAGGKPDYLPRQMTGRSNLGPNMFMAGGGGAAFTGGDPLALLLMGAGTMSSPKVSATTLGALDVLQNVGGKVSPAVRASIRSTGQRKKEQRNNSDLMQLLGMESE